MAMLSMQDVGQRLSQLTDEIARTLCTPQRSLSAALLGAAPRMGRTARELPQEPLRVQNL